MSSFTSVDLFDKDTFVKLTGKILPGIFPLAQNKVQRRTSTSTSGTEAGAVIL